MKTVVVGGTGTVGTQVTNELLKRGVQVAVMSRSAARFAALPQGATGVLGDLQKPETIPQALAGADAMFLATALAPDEINQGLAAVGAAQAAGLRYIVYMSVQNADGASHIPHFATKLPIEGAVKRSGIPYTILRPNNFFQNDLGIRDVILQHGVYPQPISEKGVSRVDVRDIAEAAAVCLTQPGQAGRTYTVAGPVALTGAATAEIYSRHLGRRIQYTGADLDGWAHAAATMMPAWMVEDLRIMFAHFLEHGLVATPAELAALTVLLGHPPRSFEAFVAEMLGRP